MKSRHIILSIILTVLVALALSIASTAIQGVVLMHLWNWFMTKLGLPAIGFWLTLGISLVVNVFILPSILGLQKQDIESSEAIARSVGTIIGYLIIWGVGAIIHLFI